MFRSYFATLATLCYFLINTFFAGSFVPSEHVLSSHTISLEQRYKQSKQVNEVFSDNILLNLAYLGNVIEKSRNVSWDKVKTSHSFSIVLMPNEVFAYHNDVLPEFAKDIVKASDIHFSAIEGFKSDGYLFGDGVCHLASLIRWAADDADLFINAPTNHDFAEIPEIPQKYGTAIYYENGNKNINEKENLYIKNTKDTPIQIEFVYNSNEVTVKIKEVVAEELTV